MERPLNRPLVVCHMVSALDGKIDGEYFESPKIRPILTASNQIREQLQCDAVIYGATTMARTYAAGYIDVLPDASEPYPRTDYIASSEVNSYYVVVDLEGSIRWESKYIEKRGRPKSHVIEILSENVSDSYIAYLRSFDISYMFSGNDSLDCELLLRKLTECFGIKRVMLAGGGIVNWSFLQAGCIDELSLILCPLADGATGVATVFNRSCYSPQGTTVTFSLKNVQTLPGDGLWLVYQPDNSTERTGEIEDESAN